MQHQFGKYIVKYCFYDKFLNLALCNVCLQISQSYINSNPLAEWFYNNQLQYFGSYLHQEDIIPEVRSIICIFKTPTDLHCVTCVYIFQGNELVKHHRC